MSTLLTEAERFFHDYIEQYPQDSYRLHEVREEILRTGTYTQTLQELTYGAKLAWRNSNRCIGRLFWDQLHVIDARSALTVESIRDALFRHISYATNEGRIRSTLTIFDPDRVRVLNHQLIRYAGYDTPDGIIGDPASIAFTQLCESFGWSGSKTDFDILPLLIELDGQVSLHPIPDELVLEVTIQHPEQNLFGDRTIKWYAVPMISDMRLEVGGISYPCAPFNGWYMGTEIGARNLADTDRYDLLPLVAEQLGLNTSRERSLWKDRALVELNYAVLDSFERSGVTIVDHHTATKQFARFEKNEAACERDVTGEWSWLVPPMSGAATHVFHKDFDPTVKRPNFFARSAPAEEPSVPSGCPFHQEVSR